MRNSTTLATHPPIKITRVAIRIFWHYWQLPLAILALLDCAFFYLVPHAVTRWYDASIWTGSTALVPNRLDALLYVAAVFLAMVAVGLYHARQRTTPGGFVVRIAVGVGAGTLVFALLDYFVTSFSVSQSGLLVMGVGVFISAALARALVYRLMDEEVLKRRVLVYGAGRRAAAINGLRRRSDRHGFMVVGYISAVGDADTRAAAVDRQIALDRSLLEICEQRQVDEIVVAMDDRRRSFPIDEFLACRVKGIRITEVTSFLERETGKVYLDVMNPSWMIFSEGFSRGSTFAVFERIFDVFASLALIVVTSPVMLLTVLAIKAEEGMGASVLYRQKRVGQYGRIFEVLKFRSMREDAENGGKPVWAAKNDNRVTRVGGFIRKMRIDELPQTLNVLKGDMSFVGPRPERPEFVDQLNASIPYYKERHTIKPGITGWAQLCYPYGSSRQDAVEKLQYDLFYVKNHSPIFYLAVLLQTVEVVLWRKGAR